MKVQNESSMKHTISTYFVWLLALMALPSCLKEGDKRFLKVSCSDAAIEVSE